jgi:hypothetical protein
MTAQKGKDLLLKLDSNGAGSFATTRTSLLVLPFPRVEAVHAGFMEVQLACPINDDLRDGSQAAGYHRSDHRGRHWSGADGCGTGCRAELPALGLGRAGDRTALAAFCQHYLPNGAVAHGGRASPPAPARSATPPMLTACSRR